MGSCCRMRLIAFGCSNTYGQGLHDCHLKGGPGPHPSKYAWPAKLAELLEVECINKAAPGASNRRIWHEVVKFDYEPNDIVIMHWTLLHRSTVLYKDKQPINLGLWNIIESNIGEPWKRYITEVDCDYDRLLESCAYIDHAELFLKDKVKLYKHIVFNPDEFVDLPKWCSFDFAVHASYYNVNYPLALDNAHTGVRGHRELAKAIYEEIK